MISYEVWMKETYSAIKPRSTELRIIDEALKVYRDGEPLRLTVLKNAFNAWKTRQGANWRGSVRNRTKICETLDAQLNGTGGVVLTPAIIQAQKVVEAANQANLTRMFRGQKLTVKTTALAVTGRDVEQTVTRFKQAVPRDPRPAAPAAPGAGSSELMAKIHELLSSTFDGLPISEVQNALGGLYHELIGSMVPYFGMFKSGGKALVGWIQVARQSWALYNVGDARGSFAPGDPAAAFTAVVELMERQRNQTAGNAAIHTATFTTQALFMGLDAGLASGPMIGAASALATVMHNLAQFARDYKETSKANKLLAAGKLDLSLFGVCPLLGAYLIACSDTSAVISMAVSEYGRPGWQFDLERMKTKADPAIQKASALIRASRYEIVSLRGNKGVVQPTLGLANAPYALKKQLVGS